jgi:hypothetical protein
MTKPKPNEQLTRIEQQLKELIEIVKDMRQRMHSVPSQNVRRGVTLPHVTILDKEIEDKDAD